VHYGKLTIVNVVNDIISNVVNELETLSAVEVANRLRPVLLKLNRELRRETNSLGLTGGQAALLFLIQQNPGIGVRELAAREGMSPPAMSGYVDRLEAAGHVTRTRSGDDRRRVGLKVTPEAARTLRTVRRRRTAWLAAHLSDLEPDELRAIDAAIDPLLRLLEPAS
jgi:DNA-binding MarR family transcriptional regulator